MIRKLALAIAMMAVSLVSSATNYQWGVSPTSQFWFISGNWNPPGIPGCLDQAQLYFGSSVINLTSPACINQIVVDQQGYTIQGQPLTFGNTNAYIQTVGSPFPGSSPITFTSDVSIDIALSVGGNSNMTFATLTGPGSISHLQSSSALLHIGNLATTGDVNIYGGTTEASPTSGSNFINFLVGGVLKTSNSTWAGMQGNGSTLLIDGTVNFGAAGDTTFSGTIADNGAAGLFEKSGNGTLTLTGNLSYTGGTTITTGTLRFGDGSTGTFPGGSVATDGTLRMSIPTSPTISSLSGAGNLTVDAGSLTVTNSTLTGNVLVQSPASLTFSGTAGTLAGDGTVNVVASVGVGASGASWQMDTTVNGAGTLIKSGTGTVTVNGNVFPPMSLSAGELKLTPSGAILGALTVSGGTLSGNGVVAQLTSAAAGGSIAPGDPIGALSITQVSSNDQLSIQVEGTSPGVSHDMLIVPGAITLGPAATLMLSGSYTPVVGDVFTIVRNDGANPVNGTFTGLPQGAITMFNGIPLRISYTGGDGNDITLSVAAHTVTATATAGGSISPSGPQTVLYGAQPIFTVTPDTGYSLTSITGCGISQIIAPYVYRAAAITGDCTVAATFSRNSYLVNIAVGSNGTVSPSPTTNVLHGDPLVLTVTPSTGYIALFGGNCPSGSLVGNTYTVASITGPCTVSVTFNQLVYGVTSGAATNGSILPAGTQPVLYGNTTTLFMVGATGYHVDTASGCGGSLVGSVYTTGPITADCTVTATFAINQYTVTPSAAAHGTISPNTPQTANHGTTKVFTVTPDTGYTAAASGCGGTLVGTTYTTDVITGDCTVSAVFTLKTYTVTPSAGAHGTIIPNTPQSVGHGSTLTVYLYPDIGYGGAVTGTCGGSLAAGGIYTTAPITADCTVDASFALISNYSIYLEGWQQEPYVITPAIGGGTLTYNPASRELSMNLIYSGLSSSETMAHIHGPAARGANAGILHTLSGANPKMDTVTLTPQEETYLLAGQLYVNIHTVNYPNGELRGQIDTAGMTTTWPLIVTTTGLGTGTVTGTTELGTVINCGVDCQESQIPNGRVVTLTATPAAGSTFGGWSGGGCSGTGTCMVTMTTFTNVSAAFDPPSTPTSADVAITQSASPNPAGVNKDIVFTYTVTNNGPAAATGISLTNAIPFGSTFVWSSPGCTVNFGLMLCSSGSLAVGASATFRLVVRPTAAGTLNNLVQAIGLPESDPMSINNSSSISIAVTTPPAGTPIQRYRLYSDVTKEHHFTTDLNEYNVLGTYVGTWVQEGGVGKILNNPGTFGGVAAVPYYRLYDNSTRWHHWTTDPNEYYTLGYVYAGWNLEGVDGWILPSNAPGTTQLYRLNYPPLGSLHHWTIDANEYTTLISTFGWIGEPGAGFVVQ